MNYAAVIRSTLVSIGQYSSNARKLAWKFGDGTLSLSDKHGWRCARVLQLPFPREPSPARQRSHTAQTTSLAFAPGRSNKVICAFGSPSQFTISKSQITSWEGRYTCMIHTDGTTMTRSPTTNNDTNKEWTWAATHSSCRCVPTHLESA